MATNASDMASLQKDERKTYFLDSLPCLLHQRVYALFGVAFTFNAIQHLNSHLDELAISSVYSIILSSANLPRQK